MSVQAQTLRDYEHIIVADHCPYAEKVYEQFKDDPRIVFTTTDGPHVFNRGGVSKNKGISMARGDYIAYCDDDNVFFATHLDELVQTIFEFDCDVVFSHMIHLRHFTKEEKENNAPKSYKRILERDLHDIEGHDGHHGMIDMLSCIHKKYLPNDLTCWPIRKDLPEGVAEDDTMIERITAANSQGLIKVVQTDPSRRTCLYNSHRGINNKDPEWDRRLSQMREDQIYVYEEIPKPKFSSRSEIEYGPIGMIKFKYDNAEL